VALSGNHMFNGETLAGSTGTAQCSGNGMVTVNIGDRLEARTGGNCSVVYLGNPQVTQSSGSTGNVAGR